MHLKFEKPLVSGQMYQQVTILQTVIKAKEVNTVGDSTRLKFPAQRFQHKEADI